MNVAQAYYPALIKAAEDHNIFGALLNELTDTDMSILNEFEGVNYSRDVRTILADDG